jgi:hypothetical protein
MGVRAGMCLVVVMIAAAGALLSGATRGGVRHAGCRDWVAWSAERHQAYAADNGLSPSWVAQRDVVCQTLADV